MIFNTSLFRIKNSSEKQTMKMLSNQCLSINNTLNRTDQQLTQTEGRARGGVHAFTLIAQVFLKTGLSRWQYGLMWTDKMNHCVEIVILKFASKNDWWRLQLAIWFSSFILKFAAFEMSLLNYELLNHNWMTRSMN